MSGKSAILGRWACDRDELETLAAEEARLVPEPVREETREQIVYVLSSLELEFADDHTATLRIPAIDADAQRGTWACDRGDFTITADNDAVDWGMQRYSARATGGRLVLQCVDGPALPLTRVSEN